MFKGAASPATAAHNHISQAEDSSDYGSDFSAEEQEIVHRLLAERERVDIIEISPVALDLEHHDTADQIVRVPPVISRGRHGSALQDESSFSKAHRLSSSALQPLHPDCKLFSLSCVK